jgi:hypothetical protein
MPSVKHRDVSPKTSRCFCQTIGKTFLYHWEDFFYAVRHRRLILDLFLYGNLVYIVGGVIFVGWG